MKRHFEKNVVVRFFITMLVVSFLESAVIQVSSFAAPETAAPLTNNTLPVDKIHAQAVQQNAAAAPQRAVEKNASQTLRGDQKKVPAELEGVGVSEHLGSTLDLENLEFIDSVDGQKHKLAEYFNNGQPVLVNLVYFECPMLCTLVLNGVKDGMKDMSWSIGKDFNVLSVSINPNDTPAMGLAKRDNYIKSYVEAGHDETAAKSGWHFMTGTEDQIKKLAEALGFDYKYDSFQKQYAHAAVTFVLTPTGKISRYLYGITYKPKDLRLALSEASEGKVGNVFDRLLLFCYHYEPSARGYTLQAVRVMQVGGLLTIVLLGGFLGLFWTRQRKGQMK